MRGLEIRLSIDASKENITFLLIAVCDSLDATVLSRKNSGYKSQDISDFKTVGLEFQEFHIKIHFFSFISNTRTPALF